jgi:hypothetical protein
MFCISFSYRTYQPTHATAAAAGCPAEHILKSQCSGNFAAERHMNRTFENLCLQIQGLHDLVVKTHAQCELLEVEPLVIQDRLALRTEGCVSVKRDLLHGKRGLLRLAYLTFAYVSKETYVYGKRDLFI